MESNLISLFVTVSSKNPAMVPVNQFYDWIISGEFKQQVEAVRQAVERGDKALASKLKLKLCYGCFSGRFRHTHRADDLVEYQPRFVLDIDNVPPELLPMLREKAMSHPAVECAFISPSGRGLKIVVITDSTREHHTEAYLQVADYFEAFLGYGVKVDRACKDVSRGHFGSYDPQAVYRTVSEPFHVHIELLSAADDEPVTAPFPPDEAPQTHTPSPHTADQAKIFVQAYLQLYPPQANERNKRLFTLACEACKRGIPQAELARAACLFMEQEGFDSGEIRRTVNSAYLRVGKSGEKTEWGNRQLTAKPPYGGSTNGQEGDEESENLDGERLRERTPALPEKVFGLIPEFLSTVVKYFDDPRERDVLLLSSITILSGCIHTTYGYYAGGRTMSNLYCFVVAPPASGKSVSDFAYRLLDCYLKDVNLQNEQLEKKFKADCAAYERSMRKHRKSGAEAEEPEKPLPPKYVYPCIPATTSKSKLIEHIFDNLPLGTIIYDNEADTVTTARSQDCGNFSDTIRKAWHNEKIEQSFKNGEKPIVVQHPNLVLLLTGTPAQQVRLTPTTEDGLFSRWLYYTYWRAAMWRNVSPGEDDEFMERYFNELSMRLLQMIRFWHTSDTKVALSPEQWDKLNETFSALLSDNQMSDREDFNSCIMRYCLMTYRICMVFTTLEKGMMRVPVKEMTCSNQHFEAALAITTTCLEHARLLNTGIKKTDKDTPELGVPNKLEWVLERLPKEFTASLFYDFTTELNIPQRTAERILRNAVGKRIDKITKGVYRKKH